MKARPSYFGTIAVHCQVRVLAWPSIRHPVWGNTPRWVPLTVQGKRQDFCSHRSETPTCVQDCIMSKYLQNFLTPRIGAVPRQCAAVGVSKTWMTDPNEFGRLMVDRGGVAVGGLVPVGESFPPTLLESFSQWCSLRLVTDPKFLGPNCGYHVQRWVVSRHQSNNSRGHWSTS